ncbi:divergent polysaccharide deacetylase family protein [Pseudoalteromonas aurantia]|uniref:divergent polysaccharide deacetylase family protein n=1 Tax=Pseudoalteromonas aurantia TaxID=43654 RepID=UPI002016528D|nr:divergent polysaccharide deacetylase family protein [Pseudoalteromonas aurantia]
MLRTLIWGVLWFCLALAPCYAKQIAIVIDDVGNHERDLELLNLPGQLSFSILPHTPYSQSFARLASQENKELLLHVPMQAIENKKLGPGALTLDMNKWQLQTTLGHALATLPQVKGVNNHMGSALTQYITPMVWTMEILKKRDLFFLDSRTTEQTQAQHAANLFGVRNIGRHVFLDNVLTQAALEAQLTVLKTLAEHQHGVIAIAHPYPETVKFLHKILPKLIEQGYELVPVSELVQHKYIQLAQQQSYLFTQVPARD